jgi:hypothetical protein
MVRVDPLIQERVAVREPRVEHEHQDRDQESDTIPAAISVARLA